MAYPKKVWVKLNRPEGEVNLRDKQGRDIGDIPEGLELTVLGIDSQGRYIVEAFIASGVTQDTDPNAPVWLWPVANPLHRINHPFNERRSYGLHEGLDLEARLGDAIRATQAGTVRKVWAWQGGTRGNNAYGNWLILEHDSGGYSSMYCHMQRFESGIAVGTHLNQGGVLGYAGSTGSSTAVHLHFMAIHPTLGLDGYVWAKVVDPRPLLEGGPTPEPVPQYATLPEGHALRGLHGPADPGEWAWQDHNAIDVIRECRFESVKTLCPGAAPNQIAVMRDRGARFIYARLFAHMGESRGASLQDRANYFVGEVADSAAQLYAAGVTWFEVHNEPNLRIEGLGYNWNNGTEFAQWFRLVYQQLKQRMPNAKLGFPGLSPGGTIDNVRQDSIVFFGQASQAVALADWLGLHQYFGNEGVTYGAAVQSVVRFCNEHKGKVVLLTEFSNSNKETPKAVKGTEYRLFYAALKAQAPPNFGTASVFVLSATNGFEHEVLIEKGGRHSAIIEALR